MDIIKVQKQAFKHLAEGNYSQAGELWQACIDAEPTERLNYWYLGLVWLLQGENADAEAIWLSALAEGTTAEIEAGMAELQEILISTGNQFLRDHHLHLAEKIYWQILDLDESLVEVHYNLGQAIAQQGDLERAIDCWQKAIDLQPDLMVAYQNQGEVYQKLGQFAEAIACYLKALALHPDYHIAYHLGCCLCQQGKWQEAPIYFQQAIELNSDYPAAYSDLGWAELQQGKWQEAIAYFQQAIKMIPDFISAYSIWAANSIQQGKAIQLNAALLTALATEGEIPLIVERLQAAIAKNNTLSNQPINSPVVLGVNPPTDFYESTQQWAIENNLISSYYINIYPQNTLALTPPKTPEATIHFSFRFNHQIELPSSFVAIVPQGRYWLNPDESASAVITANNRILGDISPEFPILSPGHPDNHPSKHSILFAKNLPAIQKIAGTVAVLSGLQNQVYFHWMCDILPRIELWQRSGIAQSEIDHFLINAKLPFQKETLNILGIDDTQILAPEPNCHIEATKLIVPSFPGKIAWMPKWAAEFLRQRFLNTTAAISPPANLLYITRHQAANRRIINEAQVIDWLADFGFQVVTLESISVVEQAALFASAKVVISAHGSGLTNLVFCHPGTKVIEIFSPNFVYHCYWLISNLVDLEYYYLLGEVPEGFYLHQILYPNPRLEDIFVDLDKLQKIMKFAEIIKF